MALHSMSLCCVLLCLMFWFSIVSFKCLLCIPLVAVCLPLSVSVFSSVLPPLVTSPGLFPPISPHLFLVSLLVSVYLVSPFPLVFVSSLPLFLLLSASVSVGVIVPQWYVFFVVVFFGLWVLVFPYLFCTLPFSLHFELFYFATLSCCCVATLVFCPSFIFVSCSFLFFVAISFCFNKSSPFVLPHSCLLSWVHLLFP